MKPKFSLDVEMNQILSSETVKQASQNISKLASNTEDVSAYLVTLAELSMILESRGLSKTASTLKAAAKSLVDEKDAELLKIAQLYGLIRK